MKKEIKVSWFPSTATKDIVLTRNGKVLDNYCTKCSASEDFGNYTLDATFTLDAQGYLEEEHILKVKLDYGDEIFRISKVTKGTKYIDIVARQMTIAESLTLYLEDVRPTNTDGQGALSHLSANATGTKEITLTSDITKTSTAYYQDMSLYKALHDGDNSFMTRWGGECLRRQYTLSINSHIGIDRGVSIREGKNLTGFSGTSNIDDLVTRARGKGSNGLFGNWIDSPLKGNYARVYTKTIEYQDVKVKSENDTEGFETEALAKAELDKRIALEFSDNDIDKLKATYTINFVQLEKTEEYKNYIVAERVYLGDTIRVYVPKVKTDIKVRAISRKYNVLAQKVDEITVSNAITINAMSTNNIIADLKKQYVNTNNNSIASYIDAIIKSGMKDSYVLLRENELLAMDTKDINTATKVVRLNKEGLAFSSNGYYGTYQYGFTIDGIINANLIATGILSAIKIQNQDGSFVMDLGGSSGLICKKNDQNSLSIEGNNIRFYRFDDDGKYSGTIGTESLVNDSTKQCIQLFHNKNAFLRIGYLADDGLVYPYFDFDEAQVKADDKRSINIWKNVMLHDGVKFYVGDSDNAFITSNVNGGFYTEGNYYIKGDFTVNGTKNRAVETTQGIRGLNAYETPSCLFADYGHGVLNSDGECIINIDTLFLETVTVSEGYEVFLTKYGKGDIWVEETNNTNFKVCGEPNLKFSWNIVLKQKGYENTRLQKIDVGDEKSASI